MAAIETQASVLLALQMAAFGWRIHREIPLADEGRLSWLPIIDYINVLGIICVCIFCFVLPLLNLPTFLESTNAGFDRLTTMEAITNIHADIRLYHYCFVPLQRCSPLQAIFQHQRETVYKDDYPYITDQEAVTLAFTLSSIALATAWKASAIFNSILFNGLMYLILSLMIMIIIKITDPTRSGDP